MLQNTRQKVAFSGLSVLGVEHKICHKEFQRRKIVVEPELALLVGLQVVSSKEEKREEREEGELFDKILLGVAKSLSWLWGNQG